MKKLIRELIVLGMIGVLTTGAFAQGKGGDKRPPKEKSKVINPDKREPPPKPPPRERPPKDNKKP